MAYCIRSIQQLYLAKSVAPHSFRHAQATLLAGDDVKMSDEENKVALLTMDFLGFFVCTLDFLQVFDTILLTGDGGGQSTHGWDFGPSLCEKEQEATSRYSIGRLVQSPRPNQQQARAIRCIGVESESPGWTSK